jgi:hypothetical protein
MVHGLGFRLHGLGLNPVSALHVTQKTPFWLAESSFRRAAIGQTRIWCLYQSNSQNLFKFNCHFPRRREKKVFPVLIEFAKKFCAPHATTPVFLPFLKIEEKRGGGKSENFISFLKCLTPPYFCLFDVRRSVKKDDLHWLKNGRVLRGSGWGGLRVKGSGFKNCGLWFMV